MDHAACKVEFQPFNRPYSQLVVFIVYNIKSGSVGVLRPTGLDAYVTDKNTRMGHGMVMVIILT